MIQATRIPHHRIDGPADAPALILGPSLGTSLELWEPHVATLAGRYRVLRYDLPGHGGSPSALLPDTRPGRTAMADLAALVIALADRQGLPSFHYAGCSLGGAIGIHLAVHHPERVASLALVCSSAHFGEAGPWRERAALVREKGTNALAASASARWFGTPETARTARGAALVSDLAKVGRAGYAACCDALAGYDRRADLPRITTPALVIAGSHDVPTPVAHARELAEGIPGAALEVVDAGHLAAVERPKEVTALLLAHLGAAV